jgi:hypothetical protein
MHWRNEADCQETTPLKIQIVFNWCEPDEDPRIMGWETGQPGCFAFDKTLIGRKGADAYLFIFAINPKCLDS